MKIKFKGDDQTPFTVSYGIPFKAGDVVDVTDDVVNKAKAEGVLPLETKADFVRAKLSANPLFEAVGAEKKSKA